MESDRENVDILDKKSGSSIMNMPKNNSGKYEGSDRCYIGKTGNEIV